MDGYELGFILSLGRLVGKKLCSKITSKGIQNWQPEPMIETKHFPCLVLQRTTGCVRKYCQKFDFFMTEQVKTKTKLQY